MIHCLEMSQNRQHLKWTPTSEDPSYQDPKLDLSFLETAILGTQEVQVVALEVRTFGSGLGKPPRCQRTSTVNQAVGAQARNSTETLLYSTQLYYTILYYILYYTILYYTILYYTILYYTILYHTIILHYSLASVMPETLRKEGALRASKEQASQQTRE